MAQGRELEGSGAHAVGTMASHSNEKACACVSNVVFGLRKGVVLERF